MRALLFLFDVSPSPFFYRRGSERERELTILTLPRRPDRSQEFFAQLVKDASAYARHAGRKHLVNEQDLVLLLTRFVYILSPSRFSRSGLILLSFPFPSPPSPSPPQPQSPTPTPMNSQRILTPKNRLQTHGRRLGLDRELQSVLDGIGGSGGAATTGKGKGKERKADAVGEGGGRKKGKGKAREEESEDEEGRVSYAESE